MVADQVVLPLLRDCEVENRDLLVLPVLLLIFFCVKKKAFVQSVKFKYNDTSHSKVKGTLITFPATPVSYLATVPYW